MEYFGREGVQLKVISGDSPLTVSSVAKRAGIPGAEKQIDLSQLDGEKDYTALSREYTVFGRVSPNDKRELIRALQRDGHGVAMVGEYLFYTMEEMYQFASDSRFETHAQWRAVRWPWPAAATRPAGWLR